MTAKIILKILLICLEKKYFSTPATAKPIGEDGSTPSKSLFLFCNRGFPAFHKKRRRKTNPYMVFRGTPHFGETCGTAHFDCLATA